MSWVVHCEFRLYQYKDRLTYRDRLIELDSVVYLTKMIMSHLVMKTLINVFLRFLLLRLA